MSLPIAKEVTLDEVPVIDLSLMHSGDEEAWKDIAKRITSASSTVGFFYVVNHGIPEKKIEEMFDLARRFFALPESEKNKISIANSDNYRGYLPFKMMGADKSIKGNLHEGFQIHAELPDDDPDV